MRDASSVVALELEDLNLFRLTTFWSKHHLQSTFSLDDFVLGAVLISESVTADDDGLLPAGDQSRNARNDNRFTKYGSSEDVSDGTVW